MKKRKLKLSTAHGTVNTPVFMPDATYGTIHNVSFKDAAAAGVREIVTTTLHIEQKLGSEYIRDFGGVHRFFGWNRPVLTDSGGFQVFSLIHRTKNKKNLITDAGASFQDFKTGDFNFLSPERSQLIQHNLGSDIRVVLDEPVIEDDSLSAIKKSVDRTTMWAEQSKQAFLKLLRLTKGDFDDPKIKRPMLTAVVQGANNFKERKRSAEALIEIGFDVYGFGGLPLRNKESWRTDAPEGFYHELIEYVASLLPEDKVRYGLGIGTPDDLEYAYNVGWDIFDSVLPTRNARHGYLYVHRGEGDTHYKIYDVLHIKTERYKFDEGPVDSKCDCECCSTVSRAYLRHLMRIGNGAGKRLATIHNLAFYSSVMDSLRKQA
ncbi:MAG: tRNA-guanine transglycosylase [Candidatus Dojkabacteria bacterium]